jgi:hypothetical protein
VSRAARAWGPLDCLLERCRVHGIGYRWHATDLRLWALSACPACRAPETARWGNVLVREGLRSGPISIQSSCCDSEAIRTALHRDPIAATLETLAHELATERACTAELRAIAGRAVELAAAGSVAA